MIKQEIEKVEKEIEENGKTTSDIIFGKIKGDATTIQSLEKRLLMLSATLTTLKKCQKIIEERDKSELEFLKKIYDLSNDDGLKRDIELKERISFLEGQK